MTSVTNGYLAAATTLVTWRSPSDHRRRTECARDSAAAAEDRVRSVFQQPHQTASHGYLVEGALAAAQVFRRRPDEFLAALPLQRNGAALCHLQRPVAKEITHSRGRLPPSSGCSPRRTGSSSRRRAQAA